MEDRDQLFVEEYMIDFNGTRAMQAVDPSLKNYAVAGNAAVRTLRKQHVREEIDRRIAERRSKNVLTVEMVTGMLRDLAEVEPLDIWDERGHIRPLHEIPPHARKAIKSIKLVEREHPITGEIETRMELELWDKKGSIELLGRFKKMFTDKVEHSGEVGHKVGFTINGIEK